MPPRTIVVNPNAPGPSLSFQMPAGVDLSVESVYAEIDASAAADTTAMLEVADSSGQVIARKRQGEAVKAGTGSGSATWALRLDEAAPAAAGFAGLPAARAQAAFATYGPGVSFATWNNLLQVSPGGVFTPDAGDATRILIHAHGLYLFVGSWLPSGAQSGDNTFSVNLTDNGGGALGGVTLMDQRFTTPATVQHLSAGTGSGVLYIAGFQSFPIRARVQMNNSLAQNYARLELNVFQMRPTDDMV